MFESERAENRERVENDQYLEACRGEKKGEKAGWEGNINEQGLGWNEPLTPLATYNTVGVDLPECEDRKIRWG